MRVTIKNKMVTYARRKIRERIGNRSVYVRRLYGKYYVYASIVTERQEKQRAAFAQAQAIVKVELTMRSRRRYWEREAKKNDIKGGRRMAISTVCKMLKRHKGDIEEVMAELSVLRGGVLRIVSTKKVETDIRSLAYDGGEKCSRYNIMKSRQKKATQLYHYNEKSINLQRGI